ncbi:MAG: transcription-repair coupling factor [Bacilli bacterium]|nr:transcription-repair coupling factor [Bacilli bacterium]
MSFLDKIFKIENEEEITGLTQELKSIYIYERFKNENKSIILVTSNLHDAGKIYSSLTHHTNKVWFFPMDDFLTSEAIAISPEFKATRLETLNSLIKEEKAIVITSLMGYLRYLPSKETFKKSYLKLEKNKEYKMKNIIEKLYELGYQKESIVSVTGEIAVRGFILDVFPMNSIKPIRIEFWGDTIESIKAFDETNQRTKKEINEITIHPNTEFLIKEDNINIPYREISKYIDTTNIKGYLKNPLIIYDNFSNIKNNYKLLKEEINNYNKSKNLSINTKYMYDLEEINDNKYITFEEFQTNNKTKKIDYKTKEIEPFSTNKEEINNRLEKYLNKKKEVIICLHNRYQVNKLIENLENKKIVFTNENEIFKGKINIIIKKISEGFENDNYVVITLNELYGKKDENNYKSKFRYGTKIKDITKLETGDYIVHRQHGIGKYLGLKTIPKNGIKKDYIMLEYQGGDKLYIPVEKIDLISKYSSKDLSSPKLNKLGSKEWLKVKARAKRKAEDIAEELLELYAIRESKQGFRFDKDSEDQIEFEKNFEYEETPDQLRVSEEIKKDMQSPKPMDRLLCGDVGYGKTEVAFRAIFKCILSGKQAAILCPTTILSSQHAKNAINRFCEFPVNIAILNRFVSSKKVKETLQKLKEGKIDLLIGTHRILSEDVIFKDLGLLVIDEEQRFGVKHKEKIKKYKNNIDVLTLSATPIPRTLQMSIAGIRSLSLIETPPAKRYPVQTYVLSENNQIIKDAIYKELARGGQTFILFNDIKNMETKQNELKKILPDVKIEIAHGKMDKYKLEDTMIRFTEGKFDVLLCTTIIETGIDIPSVNTLIIIDADHFGLSQLYQIRGRIGRSNKIAYCYLMYNNKKILTEVATKRLKVIKEFTELGSGFAIAMRDLSIRGAGDILGSTQSGYIDTVGMELFLEMLNDAVKKLEGKEIKKEEEKPTPLIEVNTSIDNNYVSEEEIKIEIHKKINTINSYKKLKEVKEELEDRFGKVSEELIIYMYEEWFEKLANKIGIKNIKQTKNFVQIELDENITNKIDGENLFYETSKLSRMFRFSMKQKKLIITLDIIKLDKHFIYYLIDFIKIVEKSLK